MKGIVLSGDSGDKLFPISLGIPKQLIPVFDKPMVYYPLALLARAGIKELLIITTSSQQDAFKASLGDGSKFGVNISFATQEHPDGIAQAITIARDFMASDDVCLITGDTLIFGETFVNQLQKAIKAASKSANATIFVTDQTIGEQYGKVLADKKNKQHQIITHDTEMVNAYFISGIYVYPNNVISKVKGLERSERNRLEILDVNRKYLAEKKLQIQKIDAHCAWLDTNTPENILKCSLYVQAHYNEL